ncbi:MAG: cyclohexanecarboxylate-CoA ligase [Sphingomonadales bacterium]|nr:cyclohexanecarboxylate-CoA ligase [Sphingomonadales bacterium]
MRNWPTAPAHLARYRNASLWSNKTIADHARVRAEATPDIIVFPNDEMQPTYALLLADATALAASLAELGLRVGDVISVQIPNWVEAATINLAACIGGFVINPIVTIYRDFEVRQMLADSRSKLLFVCETFRGYDYSAMVDRIRDDLPDLVHVVTVRGARADGYTELVSTGRGRPFATPKTDPDAVKLLLYTSGTTGRPKGVLHSHNTLARVSAVSYARWGLGEGDAILMPSPVTHISGYSNGLEQPFLAGTRTILMEAWDAKEALALIERHDVAGTVAATPFLKELADAARVQGKRLPSLRIFACGGAAVPADLVRDANAAFENPCAFRVYGSSETPLVTTGFPAGTDPELAATTDGAIADYEVRFLDDDGRDVLAGEEGEIVARGPAMFLGYADATQTRDALTDDGFFRTGDIGLLTLDGAIVITGRKKDLIIRGGENISAKEIEDVLYRHEAVAEAAIVGMPHGRLGEGICAYIVARANTAPDFATLVAFVATSGLAKQKTPERIEIVTELPRTASGKIRKDVLRERIRLLIESEAGVS